MLFVFVELQVGTSWGEQVQIIEFTSHILRHKQKAERLALYTTEYIKLLHSLLQATNYKDSLKVQRPCDARLIM